LIQDIFNAQQKDLICGIFYPSSYPLMGLEVLAGKLNPFWNDVFCIFSELKSTDIDICDKNDVLSQSIWFNPFIDIFNAQQKDLICGIFYPSSYPLIITVRLFLSFFPFHSKL
jgi:hypothetical protein